MHIIVQVWTEIDPALNVRIDRESAEPLPDPGDVLLRVSHAGRKAVSAVRGVVGARITALALGTGHEAALRHALADGAARAVELVTPSGAAPGVSAVAAWLAAERPDLVIADRRAGLLAAELGWSHLAGLSDLELVNGELAAVRHLGRGNRERIAARLPAIVRLHPEAIRLDYVSRARLHAADRVPIRQDVLPEDAAATWEASPLQPTRPRTRVGKTVPVKTARAADRLQALMGGSAAAAPPKAAESSVKTPEQLAEEFVRYLAHHDLLP